MALDWKGAFDSMHIDSLPDAMRRFGTPDDFFELMDETVTFEELEPSVFALPPEIKTLVEARDKKAGDAEEDAPKSEEPEKDAGKSGS